MKRVVDYITEKDVKDFCRNCNDLCSRHCVIWRKAENEYNLSESRQVQKVRRRMKREEAIRELKIFNGTTRIRLSSNFWEALNMAIKALEQEPCEFAISQQAAKNILSRQKFISYEAYLRCVEEIDNLPLITATRKKGKWIKVTETDFGIGYKCSECGRFILTESVDGKKLKDYPYCHCGAKMEVEE